ncbi:TorF family putative porin [Thalassolituus sp.]|jgi:uncharacterized protein (TIGR02001 family)|uniref:TorF family putative porin n=1 Tax=Thalassolituus sp. TaxID=2030822 RepID=UPI00260ACA23|nr:TorF family putative porin [uncultured Thalassolituus sp.]
MSAKRSALFILPALFSATTAIAGVTADIGATSEFVRDGISQTRGKAAWQAGITATHNSGLYLGTWGSNVDHNKDDSIHSEWDVYGGVNLPLFRRWSADLSLTRFTFHGDAELDYSAYNEAAVRLLWARNFTAGFRKADGYMGTEYDLNTTELAWTFQTSSFSIELYTANHQLSGSDEDTNFGGENTDDYWHFRTSVARSYNHWDYRLSVDRTNLGSEFDAGTIMQFSVHRYFNLW